MRAEATRSSRPVTPARSPTESQGLTQPEIADRLGLSLWAAKHKVRLIKLILESYDPMRD